MPEPEAPPEPLDPYVEAVRARLDADADARFLAMDEATFQNLIERAERGDKLDAADQAIVDAMQAQFAADFEAKLHYRTGDISLDDGLATLHLGEEFRFLDSDDTAAVLEDAWGNPPGPRALGMIGCPRCHTDDADFVQTGIDRRPSPFYDRELDARAARLDELAGDGWPSPAPFGPLQPL